MEKRPVVTAPEPVILRPWQPEHERVLIRDMWKKSYRHSPFAAPMQQSRFYAGWLPVMDAILDRSRVTVLCPADSPEATVYGWMADEAPTEEQPEHLLHYVCVYDAKDRSLSGLGYARQLLATLPTEFTVTHWTHAFGRIRDRWREENAIISGLCWGCGRRLEQSSAVDEAAPPGGNTRWKCQSCNGTKFSRPAGHVALRKPTVTVDLTMV